MLDELFPWREITVTRRRVLEMGHLRENKQEFWRRKSNITPKNPKQSWFSYKSTTTFFAQPHGIGKKQGVRCTGLYRSSQSQHACTHYRYSWIREHSTALHSRIFTLNHNLNVHIYIYKYQRENYKHASQLIYTERPIIPQSPYEYSYSAFVPCWWKDHKHSNYFIESTWQSATLLSPRAHQSWFCS